MVTNDGTGNQCINNPYRKTVEHKFAKRIDNIVQPLVSINVKLEVITKKMENPRKIRS